MAITSFYLPFNDYSYLFYEICNANFQFVVHLFPTSVYYPIATNRLIYSNKEKCTDHGMNVVVCKTINQLLVRTFYFLCEAYANGPLKIAASAGPAVIVLVVL